MRLQSLVLLTLLACQPGGNLPPIVTSMRGTVFDAASGKPVAGVAISTEPPTQELSTDASGTFAIADLSPDTTYRLSARKKGFLDAEATFAAVDGTDIQLDLTLTSTGPLLALSRSSLELAL